MILDKENYESRGVIKGFFRFVWILLSSSKVYRPKPGQRHSQGIPVLAVDVNQDLLCQSCQECEKVCPTRAIKVLGRANQTPEEFTLDVLRCTSCMDCVRACPTQALRPLGHSAGAFHFEGAYPLDKNELRQLAQSDE